MHDNHSHPHGIAGDQRKYRLLIMNLYTEMGGGEYALYNTLRCVDRNRYTPIMVFPGDGTFPERMRSIGIDTVIVPYPVVMLKRLVRPSVMVQSAIASKRIYSLMQEREIDAVQCSDLLSLLILTFPVLLKRVPVVYCVIFFYEWIRALLFNLLAVIVVDSIVANSPAVAEDLRRTTMMLDEKIETITPGVDTSVFRPRQADEPNTLKRHLQLPSSTTLVGMVGRFDPVKGHHLFIQAAAKVHQSDPEIRFVILGGLMNERIYPAIGEYYRMVLGLAQPLISEERMFFLREGEDAAEALRCLDLLVCPSVKEGFGLIVLESLSSGVPVVLSRSVGAWNLVRSMPGVYAVDEPEPDLLAGAIVSALGQKYSAQEGVREKLSSGHSWKLTARAFESKYKSVITRETVSYH